MASFTRLQANLTADGAREVGRGTSFQDATYYLDGHDPIYVSKVVTANIDVANLKDGEKPEEETARFGSLLNAPEIAQSVVDHEKASLLAKKRAGTIESTIRDRPNTPNGESWEWDHWQLGLNREETAWLNANPEKEQVFQDIVASSMRAHPNASGTRQGLITGIHKDSGTWHIQGLVSRYAMDYSHTPPRASNAVDLTNNSTSAEFIRKLQDKFNEAELPFNVSRLFVNEKTASGAPRSKFEDRATTDAAKEAYRADVAAQGGVAGARTTVGTQPEAPATARAISTITPDVERLELGAKLADDDGLKAAQRVVELEAALEAAQAARVAAAERRSTFDQAIAAIGQKEEALLAKAEAEEKAAQEAAARVEADAARDVAEEATKAAQDALEAEKGRVAVLEGEAIANAELLIREEDRADRGERLAQERLITIEEKDAHISGEPARIAEALMPVERDRDAAIVARDAATKLNEEMANTIKSIREEIGILREELATERNARESVVTEFNNAKASFAKEIADAVAKAVADTTKSVTALYENIIKMLGSNKPPSDPDNNNGGGNTPPAPQGPQGSPPTSNNTPVAPSTGSPVGEDAAKTWYTKTPDKWSDAEKDAAQTRYDTAQRNRKIPATMDLQEYGTKQFDRWYEKNSSTYG